MSDSQIMPDEEHGAGLRSTPEYVQVNGHLALLRDALKAEADGDKRKDTPAELRRKLIASLRRMNEAEADPDPPEAIPNNPFADVVNALNVDIIENMTPEDLLNRLSEAEAEALEKGGLNAGPVALRRALRHADRDERAPEHLIKPAKTELDRRQRAARRLRRVAEEELAQVIDDGILAESTEELKTIHANARALKTLITDADAAAKYAERQRKKIDGALHADPRTDWTKPAPPPDWIIPQWLATGRVHLLTGSGGRGKSRLALQIAAALASNEATCPFKSGLYSTGSDFAPMPKPNKKGVNVVFASWEDDEDEVHRRIEKIHVPACKLGDRLNYVDCSEWGPLWAPGMDGGSSHILTMAELTPAGRRLQKLCEEKQAKLLIIDPLAAAYGSDENVRTMVRQFMSSWDAWGRQHGCAILMIAHPRKLSGTKGQGDDDWWSGSTDWPAAARSAWALKHEKEKPAKNATGNSAAVRAVPEHTYLECMKTNSGGPPKKMYLCSEGSVWYATGEPQTETAGAGGADGKSTGKVDPTGIA